MKLLTIVLLLITIVTANAQTAQEYLDKGIKKHNDKDYNEAIKMDSKMHVAYFNRGTIKLATNDLKGALKDFDKTIDLDSNFIKAYYSRASVYVSQKSYKKAIPDLNKVIELNDNFPNALTLRGQLLNALKNKEAACADFQRAKEIGDPAADKYLSKFCGTKPQSTETFALQWPKSENWKLASTQEDDQLIMLDFLRNDEKLDNWTEIGTMQTIKGAAGVPMDKTMNIMFEQTKNKCPKARLTFIEKDEKAEFPWILFTIECPSFSDGTPESQLWYIVQGKSSLYVNFRAIKKSKISKKIKLKWIDFFKSGKVVTK